jgi:Thiamine biosynthesis protein ThiC
MGTIIEDTTEGKVPPAVKAAAEREGLDPDHLIQHIAHGSATVMVGGKRAVGIGRGFSAKVNVNIGTSTVRSDLAAEFGRHLLLSGMERTP